MQKKLLSLAIAGALAIPGAAMADVQSKSGGDVTIYGKFHASWDYVDAGTSNSDDSDDNTAVFRNSRLGFKGSEDLGNGLKGIWQVETHLDTGDDGVHLRNTYVGLQSDNFGKIFFGKHDTPYKTATAKLDIFSDTIADYNNIIGYHDSGSNFNEREPQLVTYETPNFNGFKAQIARESYQYDEDNDATYDEATSTWNAI
ncbi:MAG: porin, partial [Gammaproteobacteria bacterium]|nr:porin [Gammaproteobacteria bacterium]NNJ83838.1 porin [Gammaproteobacteria bacterium]